MMNGETLSGYAVMVKGGPHWHGVPCLPSKCRCHTTASGRVIAARSVAPQDTVVIPVYGSALAAISPSWAIPSSISSMATSSIPGAL
jgi:hypothetical protein